MSKIEKQLEICPPAYMCKGPNRENFVSTGPGAATARVTAGSGGRRKAAVRIYGNLVRSVKAR